MYKTNLEIAELLKSWLNSEKIIKLPKVIVPTAGIGIMARESWAEGFEKCECYYEGKSNIPKSIVPDVFPYTISLTNVLHDVCNPSLPFIIGHLPVTVAVALIFC